MVGIITGDIIQSRKADSPDSWLKPLKKLFNEIGPSPEKWEIYRGDSFQLEVKPKETLSVCFRIIAAVKTVKGLDVRIAVGIGNKQYEANSITESSGEAHVFSGETFSYSFEKVKKEKRNLVIKSHWKDFDDEMNMMLMLAGVITENWSTTSAATVNKVLENPEISQQELAKQLKISQSSVSARYKRAYLQEIQQLIGYFQKRIAKQPKEQ